MSIVICNLPKAGLGNQLFPLLKAYAFARLNNLPVAVTRYNQIKIGAYLRKEKSKRNYKGYFIFQKNSIVEQFDKWKLAGYRNYTKVIEPDVEKIQSSLQKKQCFVFSKMPHWDNYFNQLKENRQLVIDIFWKLLTPEILNQLAKQPVPVIGVHIRMGDFRKLKSGEDFSKVGAVRTPANYFVDVINGIRKVHGSQLAVSIFTDGYKHELEELFTLKNVSMVEGNADIIDLALLSKSRIIVTSAGSTFSYWSGFLADTPLIMHPDHIHQSIRPQNTNAIFYEGPFDTSNSLLVKNIQEII
jgi:uncharacterized FlgJ-related protein